MSTSLDSCRHRVKGRRLWLWSNKTHPKIVPQFEPIGLDLPDRLLAEALGHGILRCEPGRGVQILHCHHRHDGTPDSKLNVSSHRHQPSISSAYLMGNKIALVLDQYKQYNYKVRTGSQKMSNHNLHYFHPLWRNLLSQPVLMDELQFIM